MAKTKKEDEVIQENVTVEEGEEAVAPEEVVEQFEDDAEVVIPEEDMEEQVDEESAAPKERSYRSRSLPEGIGGKNRIDVAGKRKKRSLYAEESVYTDGGVRKTKKEDTLKYKEYVELAASIKNRTPLKGRLTSRRETENGDVLAEIQYGENYTVCIPAYLLTDMSLQPATDMEANNQYKDLINRRIGTTVEFIVEFVDEKKCVAYGSRIDAMVRKARQTYTAHGGRDAELKAGLLAEAQVVQTNTRGIWVEVAGSESFIEKDEISWARISDPSEIYDVGDTVIVRVMSVENHTIEVNAIKRKLNTVLATVSIKQVKQNPNEKYFDDIPIGASAEALVTQITEFGIFVNYNKKISVKCGLYAGPKQPGIGSKVLVTIKGKNKEAFQFDGKINRILKEAEV